RSPELRRRSLLALKERNGLSPTQLDTLSLDPDVEVRLQALLTRAASGESITDGVAREILVREKPPSLRLFTVGSTTEGEEQLRTFQATVRRLMPLTDLRRELAVLPILDQELKLEEIRRSFKTHGQTLREAIADRFDDWFRREFSNVKATIT